MDGRWTLKLPLCRSSIIRSLISISSPVSLSPNPPKGVVEMAEQWIRDLEERLSRLILDLWRR